MVRAVFSYPCNIQSRALSYQLWSITATPHHNDNETFASIGHGDWAISRSRLRGRQLTAVLCKTLQLWHEPLTHEQRIPLQLGTALEQQWAAEENVSLDDGSGLQGGYWHHGGGCILQLCCVANGSHLSSLLLPENGRNTRRWLPTTRYIKVIFTMTAGAIFTTCAIFHRSHHYN